MGLASRTQLKVIFYLGRYIHQFWPWELDNPIFIVGCPRSGTTILGDVLSQHKEWAYLYEPRYIWRYRRPELNIWGPKASGNLYMNESNVSHCDAMYSHWFHFSKTISNKKILLEKMPLHIFRVRWLQIIFPKAKFIHIVRHGVDVACSLEKAISTWHGFKENTDPLNIWANSWNYLMFENYARHSSHLTEILPFVHSEENIFAKTLFVWLCCIDAGIKLMNTIPAGNIMEVKYEEFITQPKQILSDIFSFIKEPLPNNILDYAQTNLYSSSLNKPDNYSYITQKIAVKTLTKLGYQ